MRSLLRNSVLLVLVTASCHKEATTPPAQGSDECFGATCVEQAEAAMWYRDYEGARDPLTAVCEKGDGFQCFRLAELHHHGRGGPVDLVKAAKFYEASCAEDYPEGCEGRAVLARESSENPELEFEYAFKACLGGRPLACTSAGEQLNTARGVERDEKRAIEMFQKGCRLGDVPGCIAAGDLLVAQNSPDSKSRGLDAYINACTGHNGLACIKAGVAFHDGVGTKRDVEKARAHFVRACEFLENEGCLLEKQLAEANGEPITLLFTTRAEQLASGNLQAHDVHCRMTEQGPSALDNVISRVAHHKDSLDSCIKQGGVAVSVSWEFEKGRVLDVKATGRIAKKTSNCVSWIMRRAKVPATGTCQAVLLLGEPDKAAKSWEARVAARAKRENKKQSKVKHINASELDP